MSELSPQPPPDIPAPPPGPEALRSRGIMKAITVLGIGCMILVVLFLLAPFFLKSKKAADRTEAINNAKQVGLSLQDFDAAYGRFPDFTTAPLVKAKTGTALTLSSGSSNQLFRQLIATGLKSEKPFYAKTTFTHKPDDNFSDDAHAIAPGECGFAYVNGLSASDDPETPVLMAPMIRGTTQFEPRSFKGKAVILRVDDSATSLPIDAAGHAIFNGMDLFDPRQPFWHGKVPDLKWAE